MLSAGERGYPAGRGSAVCELTCEEHAQFRYRSQAKGTRQELPEESQVIDQVLQRIACARASELRRPHCCGVGHRCQWGPEARRHCVLPGSGQWLNLYRCRSHPQQRSAPPNIQKLQLWKSPPWKTPCPNNEVTVRHPKAARSLLWRW